MSPASNNGIPHLPKPPRRMPDQVYDQLKAAVSADDWDAFDLLLYSGPNGLYDIDELYLLMFEAIKENSVKIVEKLLSYGMTMRYTFVLDAIQAKAKDSLDIFLQNGWDINRPLSETEPTLLAYTTDNEEMTLWLVDHGADLNRQTYIDLTPMSYAVRIAPLGLVETLLDRGGDVQRGELLQNAIERSVDTVEVLKLLIYRGAPLNMTIYENHQASSRLYPFMELGTPLHKTTTMGKTDVVRYLLERGADVTIKNTKGYTAVECAARAGFTEVVEILNLAVSGAQT